MEGSLGPAPRFYLLLLVCSSALTGCGLQWVGQGCSVSAGIYTGVTQGTPSLWLWGSHHPCRGKASQCSCFQGTRAIIGNLSCSGSLVTSLAPQVNSGGILLWFAMGTLYEGADIVTLPQGRKTTSERVMVGSQPPDAHLAKPHP